MMMMVRIIVIMHLSMLYPGGRREGGGKGSGKGWGFDTLGCSLRGVDFDTGFPPVDVDF